jgi:peptide/nickel transport system permease protein
MSENNTSAPETLQLLQQAAKPRVNEFRRIIRVISARWINIVGLVIIALFIIAAIFAPLFAPYDPYKQDLPAALQQPSAAHLLGTDDIGRDTLSRTIYGARISLIVGLVSVLLAAVIGTAMGLCAGYFGGWVQTIIMRFIDALMSIPPIILMMSVAAVLGGGLRNIFVALSIGIIPVYCRLTNGQIMSTKESDFITAAVLIGASPVRIMIRHLLPNSFATLLVAMTMNLGFAILAEASLSFLGIGISPPTATWGSMVNDGYRYLLTNPMLSFAPGVSILAVVLSFNLVGDGLRDALDPRLRGII